MRVVARRRGAPSPRSSKTRDGIVGRDGVPEQLARARRPDRRPTRRAGAAPSDATPARTRAPVHAAISAAPRAAPRSSPSGSVPRSNRCDASECRSSRRAVSRTPPRVNDADSSRTSVVLGRDLRRPPAHDAGERHRAVSRSQISRSWSVERALDVVEGRQALARRGRPARRSPDPPGAPGRTRAAAGPARASRSSWRRPPRRSGACRTRSAAPARGAATWPGRTPRITRAR